MKRPGPLHRKTDLSRKTPMKRISDKTRKLKRETDPERRAFVQEQGACAAAAFTEGGERQCFGKLTCHEIVCGGSRVLGVQRRETWLCLCERHNGHYFTNYRLWPPERQCALKLVSDPENFDLDPINELRGRADTAIVWADVAPYLTMAEVG